MHPRAAQTPRPQLLAGQTWLAFVNLLRITCVRGNDVSYVESSLMSHCVWERSSTVPALRSALAVENARLVDGPFSPWSPDDMEAKS